MLTKWVLGNFKAISEKTTFSFGSITVLVGENSSGKSSVLQSILLMAQTLKATQSKQPLLLNGEFIRLGYLKDILHNRNSDAVLDVGFELDLKSFEYVNKQILSKRSPIQVEFQVSSEEAKEKGGVLKKFSLRSGSEDSISLAYENKIEDTLLDASVNRNLQMSHEMQGEINSGRYSSAVRHIEFSQGTSLSKIEPYEHYCSLYHFLPDKILETYDATQFSLATALKSSGGYLRFKGDKRSARDDLLSFLSSDTINFNEEIGRALRDEIRNAIYSGANRLSNSRTKEEPYGSKLQYRRIAINYLEQSGNLEEWLLKVKLDMPYSLTRELGEFLINRAVLVEQGGEDDAHPRKIAVRSTVLPASLENIKSQIIQYFSERVYYLGPLREDPRFIYALPPYPELTHVGLKGEFTASVLEKFKDHVVEYPIPTQSNGEEMMIGKAPLIVALSYWLEHMGLLEKVTTTDRGKIGTELAVHAKGVEQPLDLTSIGVGVSQVLPTLVMGLIAPKGTTFLLEQPELHLHPKVQSIVADFLLGLAKLGKQCIVETHSEYLVSRLRLRVAEDETNTLASQTSIYFVERFNGKSSFRKLDLNQYGALLEWPEGFMDQGTNEAELIMRAALKKRQQKQQAASKREGK